MAVHPSWADIEEAVVSDPPSPDQAGPSNYDSYTNGSRASFPHHQSNGRRKANRTASGRIRNSWKTNDWDVTDLGQERLDDYIQVVKCDQCSKTVLARYADYHKRNCDLAKAIQEGRASPGVLEPDPRKRKRRLSDVSETPSQADGGNGAYASASSVSPQKKLTKKAARALEVEERRKQRLEKKARKEREAAESKGRRRKGQPLDVNRQCGVINDNGLPCMRSLTCKTHSMGAKRSVPGRSKSYDELLLEWQKANNPAFLAKLEKKEEERAKALEEKRLKKLEKKKKKDAKRLAASGADGAGSANGTGAKGSAKGEGGGRGSGHARGGLGGLNGELGAQGEGIDGSATDLYALGMDDREVESELQTLLAALRNHTRDERLITVPLVPRRTYHGLYTAEARRMSRLRQAFAGGSGGSSGLGRPTSSLNGSATTGLDTGSNGAFRHPPVVAGGGWGSGIFASHA
ncbi:unnamed protein product [Parajaminaea phylloscopi]